MEKGFVKTYNSQNGFGFITSEKGNDVFFHINNVSGELAVLLTTRKGTKEPVLFNSKPSEKVSGRFEATKVSLDLEKRKVGYIERRESNYDQDIFFIKDYYSDDRYFLHHSNIRKINTDRFVRFEEQDPVIFSPSSNEKGLIALDVVIVDTRTFIQGFAEFQDYNSAIELLGSGNLCEEENWDYIQNKTGGFPILKSYINQTCKRVVDQGKLVTGTSKSGDVYAYFNTGLVDEFQNDIFAYFEKNRNYQDNQPWGIHIPEWWFLEFNTDQSLYYKYFVDIPDIATYFEEAETSKLIFDTRITIRPNWEHLNDRKKRVNSIEIQNMSEQDYRDAISDSIEMAKKRIKRNYKTAIPHYYNGDIQFLIPMCEKKNRGKALAAMVINKTEQIYEVATILTLDQAYNNARLLAKPDREWLNP